jgi:hypothetical protein
VKGSKYLFLLIKHPSWVGDVSHTSGYISQHGHPFQTCGPFSDRSNIQFQNSSENAKNFMILYIILWFSIMEVHLPCLIFGSFFCIEGEKCLWFKKIMTSACFHLPI